MQGKHTNKTDSAKQRESLVFGIFLIAVGGALSIGQLFLADPLMRLGIFVLGVISVLVGYFGIYIDVMLPATEKRIRRRIESEMRLKAMCEEKKASSAKHMR